MSTERSNACIICPYCGHYQPQRHQCAACNGWLDPLSQKATQIDMGPWFIRDAKQPYRPGCSHEIIQRLAKAGRIDAGTILRGPTTYQYWTAARLAPGVSHLVGFCYRCSTSAQPTDTRCSKCQAVFTAIPLLAHRNELGLRFPTAESAAQARQQVEKERPSPPSSSLTAPISSDPSASVEPAPAPAMATMATGSWPLATDDSSPAIHLSSIGANLLRDIAPSPLASAEDRSASDLSLARLTNDPSDPKAIAAAIASGLHKLPSPPPASITPTAWPNPTAPLPQATASSKWTIALLVLLNVLLLAIVIAVVMMLQG